MSIYTWKAAPTAPDSFDCYLDDTLVSHHWQDAAGAWWEIPAGSTGTPRRSVTHGGMKGHNEYLKQERELAEDSRDDNDMADALGGDPWVQS